MHARLKLARGGWKSASLVVGARCRSPSKCAPPAAAARARASPPTRRTVCVLLVRRHFRSTTRQGRERVAIWRARQRQPQPSKRVSAKNARSKSSSATTISRRQLQLQLELQLSPQIQLERPRQERHWRRRRGQKRRRQRWLWQQQQQRRRQCQPAALWSLSILIKVPSSRVVLHQRRRPSRWCPREPMGYELTQASPVQIADGRQQKVRSGGEELLTRLSSRSNN